MVRLQDFLENGEQPSYVSITSSCFIPVEEPIRCKNDLKSRLDSIPLATESDPESDRPLVGNLFEDAMSQMHLLFIAILVIGRLARELGMVPSKVLCRKAVFLSPLGIFSE